MVMGLRMLSIGLYLSLFASKTVHNKASDVPFRESSKQPTTASGLLCFTAPEALDSCLTILFPLKSTHQHYGPHKARNTSTSCVFAPEISWIDSQNGPKISLKITPTTEGFVHFEDYKGVPQVLDHSIFIVRIQNRVRGLEMLSTGLHLALLCPKLSVIRLPIALSEELKAVHNH